MALIDEVRSKVFDFTKDMFSKAELDGDGYVTFDFNSTKLWIDVIKMVPPCVILEINNGYLQRM
jgi:hypothetical protein